MISVCMATYNGESYIKEQIESILPQLSKEDEIIIVDDLSKDNTLNIINSINDKRIKVLKNTENQGVIKTFERAIDEANGDYIFLSDQDDIWMTNKIAVIIEYFKLTKCDLIISDAYIMSDGIIGLDTFYDYRKSKPGIMNNIIKNSFIGCCMAFTSKMKGKVLPIPKNFSMHDLWIGLLASHYGKVIFISDRLIVYRRHSSNVTQMNKSPLMSMIYKRKNDIQIILNRIIKGV